MLFNSIEFLLFFPAVVILYFVLPSKYRWFWLLLVSYYFYMNWSAKYLVLILISTLITYASGLLIEKFRERKKLFLLISLISNLGILFFFKYYNFVTDSLKDFFETLGYQWEGSSLNVLLPVGISFYTFQALSYTIDVYRGNTPAEKHFGKYALFVSFFPQLVAGPIEKSKNLLPQFSITHKFNYERIREGLLLMLWGYFKKVVIADRLALFVNQVYDTPGEHHGFSLIIATFFFAFQIYCDFSSYTDIAIGAAKVMGFDLQKNFDRPYFSKSIPEFWRRWHISLGAWFKEYLYFSLGGNRVSKSRLYINIMIVFLVSGLWHGASWNFVIWGFLHGIYQVIHLAVPKNFKQINTYLYTDKSSLGYKIYNVSTTFFLVCFAWIFFRANTFKDAMLVIVNSLDLNTWTLFDGSLFELGLDKNEFIVAILALLILLAYDLYDRRHNLFKELKTLNIIFRWSIYILVIYSIIIFGIFGDYEEAQFIYFQF